MMKNKKVKILFLVILLLIIPVLFLLGIQKNPVVHCEKSVEYNGETYEVVKIGNQCWFAENLRTKKYSDGSSILRIDSDEEWSETSEDAYSVFLNTGIFVKDVGAEVGVEEGSCGVANEPPSEEPSLQESPVEEGKEEVEVEKELMSEKEIVQKFGYLYNFHAVKNLAGLCPEGWSIPSHEDWNVLEGSVCTSDTCDRDFPEDLTTVGERGTSEGAKLSGKESLWFDGMIKESSAFGISGFNAVPGGYRDIVGPFSGQGLSAYFWTLPDDSGGIWTREIHNSSAKIVRQYFQAFYGGMSARCVKDGVLSVQESPFLFSWEFLKGKFSKNGGMDFIEEKPSEEKKDNFRYTKLSEGEITEKCPENFVDERNGKTYSVVQIGNACWMGENLQYDFEDATCYPSSSIYGCYYNWEASQQACPIGWKLPSDNDWKKLEMELGMSLEDANKLDYWRYSGEVGGKLKSEEYWEEPNECGGQCNTSGFNLLPAGSTGEGEAQNIGKGTNFWTSTKPEGKLEVTSEGDEGSALLRRVDSNDYGISRNAQSCGSQYSVRCIKE